MKLFCILLSAVFLLSLIPLGALLVSAASVPTIQLNSTVFDPNQTITLTFSGTDTKDWAGIYPFGILPGATPSLTWQYTVGNGTATFNTADLPGAGDYRVYLCDNDGYTVLDSVGFTVRGADTADYGVRTAEVIASVSGGRSEIAVRVTPSSAAALTYRFYWAKNGVRLADWLPIKELSHSGADTFTVQMNSCLFMPDEADSIEVAVVEGHSSSRFAAAPANLKVPPSALKYKFQVLTDIHIASSLPTHTDNLKGALRDIAAVAPDSIGIFTAGDNTNTGTQADYDLFKQTLADAGVPIPPITYAIGNHDEVYGGTYAEEIERFKQNCNAPALYYSVERNGARFIMLGSDEQTTAGELYQTQIDWLRNELQKTDPATPTYIFLHQSLKDTVSGSLTALGQRWYGVPNAAAQLRAILKNYPNAIFFSGHTHWALEMTQPFLYGNGTDAHFINAASVGYLWTDSDEELKGSEGLYVEVYDDYILIKGREFTQSSWCGAAQFLIPLHDGTGNDYDGSLISASPADWNYDNAVMNITATASGVSLCNTNGNWPSADYAYKQPITIDPAATSLYVDMILEDTANANLYLYLGREAISINSILPKLNVDTSSGDLIGNGRRVRGTVPVSKLPLTAACFNEDGSITAKQTRIYASGAANARLTIYDLSFVHDRTDKTVSLMNADTLAVADPTLDGGYVYDRGTLTVNADSDSGYSVRFDLNEAYRVTALRQWLMNVQSTVPFNITLNATADQTNVTFGLAADFWPDLCDALDSGFIPAGTYQNALNLFGAYDYNRIVPENGLSTIHSVTITLGGKGSLTLNGLQLSSGTQVAPLTDDTYRAETTTARQKGDVDGKDGLSTNDARVIMLHSLESVTLPADKVALADVNGDGEINTTDVRLVMIAVLND